MAGCAPGCPLDAQRPTAELRLYFGEDSPAGQVDDAQWRRFAATMLTRAFSDGFTVYDAHGQWRDGRTGIVSAEPSRVVEVLGPISAGRVRMVIDGYRKAFRQKTVGVVSQQACAAF